jgi:hypothetical protein
MFDTSFLKEEVNIGEKDKLLIRLSFADIVAPDDLVNLLSDYDIENARLDFNLLLAYLLKKYPDLGFPKEIVPRLEGVIRFFQYKNATLLHAFKEVGAQLNLKKIPILLIKGILMRYINPNEPRLMFDVDFIVPEKDYEEAVQTAVETGFTVKLVCQHSTDLVKDTAALDVHYLFMHETDRAGAAIIKEMFARAKNTTAFGIDVLIPALEDWMIVVLTNAYHNVVVEPPSATAKEFFYFYDIAKIIKSNKDLNWDVMLNTAAKAGILYQIRTILDFFDEIVPGMLPSDLFAKIAQYKKIGEAKIKRDIIARNSNKLRYDQWRVKLSKCRSLKDFAFCLDINVRTGCLEIMQKNSVACYLFAPILYPIIVRKRKNVK